MPNPPRRRFQRIDPREAAEAVFKPAPTKPPLPDAKPAELPRARELVTLRIDRDILERFQEAGPGWQDRINDALRQITGK